MSNVTIHHTDLLGDDGRMFLTDGGIETTLIFHEGFELPEFAAFPLLEDPRGISTLQAYFERYVGIARQHNTGFIFESPTWRASSKWAQRIGYTDADVDRFNIAAIDMLAQLRSQWASNDSPMLISGCVGPQDDGYRPEDRLSVGDAEAYHRRQIAALKQAGVNMISAVTMTYVQEAIGIANAAAAEALPAVVSFTVETDGRLPTGMRLADAIRQVDKQASALPVYYMINCAHPDHFDLPQDESWLTRICGVRANASRMSHAELDESETLDAGDPQEFAKLHQLLRHRLPNLRVFGGCCGTDHRHVSAIADACCR